MANFDPLLRRETWCFQRIGRQAGHSVYRRLGFNLVSYDDDPQQWIEPVNENNFIDTLGQTNVQFDPQTDFGRVVRFEYFDGAMPFQGMAFGADVNIDALQPGALEFPS